MGRRRRRVETGTLVVSPPRFVDRCTRSRCLLESVRVAHTKPFSKLNNDDDRMRWLGGGKSCM